VKLGTENRNKVILSAVLGGLAIILVARMLFFGGGSAPPATPSAAGVPNAPAAAPVRVVKGKRVKTTPRSLDPSLRYDWLKASEDTKYEGNGRNIFKAEAEIPQPITPVLTEQQKEQLAHPPPPPPPPINLKFFGFASGPGEPKRIFLSQGEDVFIAAEGEIVDRHYKILHIAPMSVEVEDMLNNNRQSIPLTQG
jgi:hypothetical protein